MNGFYLTVGYDILELLNVLVFLVKAKLRPEVNYESLTSNAPISIDPKFSDVAAICETPAFVEPRLDM